MVIEKRKLFEQTRNRWPRGLKVYPTNGFQPFDSKPSLHDIYTHIEAACSPKGEWTEEDEWTGLANWAFHQALGRVVDRSTSERYVDRDEVTFEMFDEWMRFNLSDECWVAERQQYEGSPLRFH